MIQSEKKLGKVIRAVVVATNWDSSLFVTLFCFIFSCRIGAGSLFFWGTRKLGNKKKRDEKNKKIEIRLSIIIFGSDQKPYTCCK